LAVRKVPAANGRRDRPLSEQVEGSVASPGTVTTNPAIVVSEPQTVHWEPFDDDGAVLAVPSTLDMVVVGGCGHVGLPLALMFASVGCRVGIFDPDVATMERVQAGEMPFKEAGADRLLAKVLGSGQLEFSNEPAIIRRTSVAIIVIGTPIDEFMNPSMRLFERVVDDLALVLRDDSLVILRSTVYPGTTEFVEARLGERGLHATVAFCPERIAEGHALEEIRELPQLIGAASESAFLRASAVFAKLGVETVRATPKEAELAKLFTNTWRYMKFAIANQFFQIAHRAGLDYDRILYAIKHNYPRAADLPGPGLSAGPCLLKDTMQLAAFTPDHFPLGNAAMLINEGLPAYILDCVNHRDGLAGRTIGILGMAFKGESDDSRSSLSYKLKKLAVFKGAKVLCTDPYVQDPSLVTLPEVIRQCDILIVAAPHQAYRDIDTGTCQVVDIWGITGHGIRL
jgi:UDP-N-acetyl-D-mannosaminuronic acid dehydrogenase